MPAVSAVIPTYNRLPLLMEAVESVRAQTFEDWELIVADDGSTDGSAEAVEALGDARIRVLRLPHARDEGRARNAGVAAARAEWVAFLDSDDLWLPRKLEVQIAATRAAGVRWSYAGAEMMDAAGRPLPFRAGGSGFVSGRIVREVLTLEATVFIDTLMVSRALFDEAGGFAERLGGRADHDFALRLAERADAVAVPQVLARVREHGGRMTGAMGAPHEKSARVYERFLQRNRAPGLRRVAFEQLARLLVDGAVHEARGGRRRRALRLLLRSLRYDPPPARWARAVVAVARAGVRLGG
jgi:glycosyltransferase involved in cell wall biosynthesis